MKKKLYINIVVFAVLIGWYLYRFYPRQQMPIGKPLLITTPQPEKYHNDCLHPCIREMMMDSFVMVQSPYYGWNNKIENPIIYMSSSLENFGAGRLLADTPNNGGYNSDPNVFVDDSLVYVFWRECETKRCKEKGVQEMVIGGLLRKVDSQCINTYLADSWSGGDMTQCPILLKHDGKYMFFAVWYQYGPIRKNKGIAIWEGNSLERPDFRLMDTIPFDNPLVCDKLFQKKIGGSFYFVPFPKRYDLWHFDLFEYNGLLFMVSCAEKDDNIMLSVSKDWRHFKTNWEPLINNHYSENHTGYRQYYYKPTAIVKDDSLYLYYTARSEEDPNKNQLFLSIKAMKDIKY